ncbi:LysR family transcriptional regulator [Roseibium sp. RKSG952]|uniref:LysR family transcriptional regulator n=1 Tax=Roseibium sp. RKSG952 TaxID=2529384 RepID=UPI0012BB4BFD|nr:LysR family transcriptional regulator [Roseibium sp. RKSG952]MTH97549.1 LysR family transcriptional regulator [Roseibium sp. RKSG952]
MKWRDIPSLSSLRAFCAVAQTRSYSTAGRALNVTHAAVSQQVRALESHFGFPLVVREGRGIALTPEGQILFEGVHEGFARILSSVEQLSDDREARPLNVTATPTFAVSWLMPRISEFRMMHPDIELMLNTTAEVVSLEPGGVDLAIRYGGGEWPGLDAELLLKTNYVVVGATSLVGDVEVREPEDLLQFPWLQEAGTNEIAMWLEKQGVIPTGKLSVSHLPGYMVLDGLRRGDGICAASREFVAGELEAGHLKVLFEDLRGEGSGYYIVTRPGVQRAPVKTFVSWLRSHKGEGAAR